MCSVLVDKKKLPREYNRRVKLTSTDLQNIEKWYLEGCSITSIAKEIGCSKRLVQFKLFPERLKRNINLRNKRGGSKIYYDREKHNQSIKNLREYKKQLIEEGKI